MRILQVVALISPDGEYGGPVRVAFEQSRALIEAGHDVVLVAGTWGYDTATREMSGVPVRLFPARTIPGTGLRGLFSLGSSAWLRRHVASADAVHVHLGRDLVTLPAADLARRQGVPYVVQTHGMVQPTRNPLAPALDALLTRRVLRDARAVFHLTEVERRGLLEVEPDIRLTFLRNGIGASSTPRTPASRGREVLFLARMHERKRPLVFVDMAIHLAPEFPDVTFRLVGPDEGQGEAVRERISRSGLGDRIVWDGPLDRERTGHAMGRAHLYVLPSVNEPYPMTVLEALAGGLPVVITDTCGLAPLITGSGAGVVVGPDPGEVDDAVRSLLADPDLLERMSEKASATAQDELGMSAVTELLVRTYRGGA